MARQTNNEVNKSTTRIEKPTISIDNGSGSSVDMTNDIQADSNVSTNWRNQEVTLFSSGKNNITLTITITPDPKYSASTYRNRTVNDFVGLNINNSNSKTFGNISYTYYTLNGKIPQRTKSNLYIGPFTLKSNKSGSDNTVLKARTYYNGRWSEVMTTEFRINRRDTHKV